MVYVSLTMWYKEVKKTVFFIIFALHECFSLLIYRICFEE